MYSTTMHIKHLHQQCMISGIVKLKRAEMNVYFDLFAQLYVAFNRFAHI